MKKVNLSAIVIKMRTFALGGAHSSELIQSFRVWKLNHHYPKYIKQNATMRRWCELIEEVLTHSLHTGSSITVILNEIHPLIRQEERQIQKVKSIEKQFAFQGAIIAVLPWMVVGLFGSIQLHLFAAIGITLQTIGLLLLLFIIRKTLHQKKSESSFLKEITAMIWIRVLSGNSLPDAIEKAIIQTEGNASNQSNYLMQWKHWYLAMKTKNDSQDEFFDIHFVFSRELSEVFQRLVEMGAPSLQVLSETYKQIEEECRNQLEERILALPTVLSLVLSFFLTPACILIIMGIVWPQIQMIM